MPTPDSNRLGDVLAAARTKRGVSLNQLAKDTGIHRTSISRIESGEFTSPRPAKLLILAEALDLDPSELFEAISYPAVELPTFSTYLQIRYRQYLSEATLKRIENYALRTARQEDGIDLNKLTD